MAALRGLGRFKRLRVSPTAPGTWPLQRMANVSLAAPRRAARLPRTSSPGWRTGIYILGDKSWSIDMQRYKLPVQRASASSGSGNGRPRTASWRDVAYQANHHRLLGFDGRPSAGPQTYVIGGAFQTAARGQPGQVAPVSHGCPAVLLRGRADTQHGGRGSIMSGPSPAGNRRAARAGRGPSPTNCVVIAEEDLHGETCAGGGQHPHHQRRGQFPAAHRHSHRPARCREWGTVPPPAWCPGPVSRPDQIEDVGPRGPSTRPPRPPPAEGRGRADRGGRTRPVRDQ